jgi:hypothetical protein
VVYYPEVAMARTKVKLFQNIVSVSPGLNLQREFTIEGEINEFLANPAIKLIDVKLSSNAAPVGDRVAHYGLSALLIYEEA